MKKTLVALAALAATGAFAQATVSGSYGFGWKQTRSAAGADQAGMGVDTAIIKLSASEDLGGGTKVTVNMGVDGVTRGSTSIEGADSNINIATANMGTFDFSLAESADFITRSTGNAGGPSQDGRFFAAQAGSEADAFAWSIPLSSSLTFMYDFGEADKALGTGSAGAASVTVQRQHQVRVNYASGALSASLRYAVRDAQIAGDEASVKDRIRAAAKYDMGSVAVGAAYERRNFVYGNYRNDYGVSLGLPMGALTLGGNWVARTTDGSATTASNGTRTGYGLSASYALSKRTSLNANYYNYKAALADTDNSTEFNTVIMHNF